MKKIIHIVGNRPHFIKLAVLYKAIDAAGFNNQIIIHTGQHASNEMSTVFFKDLAIPKPDVQLNITNSNPDQFIADATQALSAYLAHYSGSIVFTYGDTNSTLAAALSAVRLGMELHHFESGVRTGDYSAPEEMNRLITERFSSTQYCCTQLNYQTMLAEGYGTQIPANIFLTGDLMYDAFLKIPGDENFKTSETEYIACTIHRAANIKSVVHLTSIINALNLIHKKVPVLLPLHPHTKKQLEALDIAVNFMLLPPLGYPQMKAFIENSTLVITDSGGVTREAFFSKRKSIVIMDNPPWPEIIKAGCGLKCGPTTQQILTAVSKSDVLEPGFEIPIFGVGAAGEKISTHLLNSVGPK